jgi:flagellar biosynthesis protein FliP
MSRRREGHPAAVRSCFCDTLALVAPPLRRHCEDRDFFSPLVKGGLGGVVPAQPLAGPSEGVFRTTAALDVVARDQKSVHNVRGVRLQPPLPSLLEGRKADVRGVRHPRARVAHAMALCAGLTFLVVPMVAEAADEPAPRGVTVPTASPEGAGHGASVPIRDVGLPSVGINKVIEQETPAPSGPMHMPPLDRGDAIKTVQTVALFGLVSLAPMGLLMVTAFVRINIVLILLRQALGSPQVPGNQVLTALALLLTAVVMRPLGEKVYHDAIVPYTSGKLDLAHAWSLGTEPIKVFMVNQIKKTNHEDYLEALQEYAVPPSLGQADLALARTLDFPLRVVAPAYMLSELTTALMIGFYIYLPFLVIDLVVSSVLAATGLFMLPPALVATPIKLIVFVLADGWLLIATMLLSSFAPGGP